MQGGGLSPVGNRLPGQNGGGCGFCCSEAGEVGSGKREAVCLSQEGEQWRRQSQSKEGDILLSGCQKEEVGGRKVTKTPGQ